MSRWRPREPASSQPSEPAAVAEASEDAKTEEAADVTVVAVEDSAAPSDVAESDDTRVAKPSDFEEPTLVEIDAAGAAE